MFQYDPLSNKQPYSPDDRSKWLVVFPAVSFSPSQISFFLVIRNSYIYFEFSFPWPSLAFKDIFWVLNDNIVPNRDCGLSIIRIMYYICKILIKKKFVENDLVGKRFQDQPLPRKDVKKMKYSFHYLGMIKNNILPSRVRKIQTVKGWIDSLLVSSLLQMQNGLRYKFKWNVVCYILQ